MTRLSKAAYERHVMIAMSIYVLLLLLVWPLTRDTAELLPKIAYALLPIAPLLYVIWLLWRRIRDSDELEQRTHLIGLGVASAFVSVFSLVCAFLALSKVMTLDAAAVALLWVFPLLMITYGLVRGYAARRYGSNFCDDDEGWPYYVRFLLLAAFFSALAAYARFREHDDFFAGVASGMAVGLVLGSAFLWLRKRLRKNTPAQ